MRRQLAPLLAALCLGLPSLALAHGEPPHRGVLVRGQAGGHWDRDDPRWWRGRPEWRGYHSPRPGFWFAPGWGYYPVDARLWGHEWRRGQYLPEAYRHRIVRDWAWFGLRPPPRGYAWVWCGRGIALASQGSGLILDVVPDVF